MNTTTRTEALNTLTHYFYPLLKKTEDFDSFSRTTLKEMRSLSADVVACSIEAFDKEVRASMPRGWKIKDAPVKTIITLLGKVTYVRTLFVDQYGRYRYLTDEILGIKKRSRFSDDAFLWIVKKAAFVSFRKTAKEFQELTGVAISQVSVMNMVHEEGSILKKYLLSETDSTDKISHDRLYVESDGVFIALQSAQKRKAAIDGHLYEKDRKKRSIELKCAISYAGKTCGSKGMRKKRGNVLCACSVGSKEELFDMVASDIVRTYDIEDIDTVCSGSDGAACYRDHGLENLLPEALFTHTLDPFHVLQAVTLAFPARQLRSKMMSLVCAQELESFDALSAYLSDVSGDEISKKRISVCRNYLKNNADSISFHQDLGTMEGTISHTWAKRMKNNATSWSRRGMEAMGLVRAFVCFNRDLIAPSKQATFTEREQLRRDRVIAKSFVGQPCVSGNGYLPHQATLPTVKKSGISEREVARLRWCR